MKVKVKDRQSLLDIAIQTSGSIEAAWGLALANGVGLTETLYNGQELETVSLVDPDTVNCYEVQQIEPATALSAEEETALLQEGIGFMGIEVDFVVS